MPSFIYHGNYLRVFLSSEPFLRRKLLFFIIIDILLIVQNPSLLPTEVLNLLATNRKTYDYILHNFPDSLIAKSIRQEEALFIIKLIQTKRKRLSVIQETTL
jgi:hypothetical protein